MRAVFQARFPSRYMAALWFGVSWIRRTAGFDLFFPCFHPRPPGLVSLGSAAISGELERLLDKCPLKFPVVKQIACLDPARMNRDPEWCITQMKNLVQTFIQGKQLAGGIAAVPLTKELLASAASTRSHYRLYLENEQKKKESAIQQLKRKAAEKELEDLRNQRRVLNVVCDSLEVDADKFAEIAEGKTGRKMAELITKSNSLRRRHKDKKAEMLQVDKMIEEKATQLRHL
ncbi:Thyroid hormone receptor-associated 3 [Labeo rohita]|uniref:Thyroid hormone receptor-associated 3 n=1 Tax=Labeo rohita TaxID=84645 RepID=A0A498N942_LABRO|nr:Thyroid hormone receptor-associated 3 [Labeo rohita]RXN29481.1 Thyroid hormone receptor-associated 3 [Labeo rohita]